MTLELTDEEATKFRIFMDNYTLFNSLIEAGLHKAEYPQYTLYFNKFGVLKSVEIKKVIHNLD